MPGAAVAAKNGSLEEFLHVYEAKVDDPTDLLVRALTNKQPAARVAIADRLLDDGADAGIIQGGNSTVNVLFGQRKHDVPLEAPLLQRLLDLGADVNHASRLGDEPLIQLLNHVSLRDPEMAPFYDVMFARTDLDLDATSAGSDESVRDRVHASGGFVRPLMRERVDAYRQG